MIFFYGIYKKKLIILLSIFFFILFVHKNFLEIEILFEVFLIKLTQNPSPSNIKTGFTIPSEEGYVDQPYVIKLKNGSWLCVMTTGENREGAKGQYIASTISKDRGKTWTPINPIEPINGPEASWAMPLLTPNGRIYVFYTYNFNNIRNVKADTEYYRKRVDYIGKYAFKFSDDDGKTWSEKRWYIPVRSTDIDKNNLHKGDIMFFWGVGKPITSNNSVYMGFSKIGKISGAKGLEETESWILKSNNILHEKNPDKINWETLPSGNVGLKSPIGSVAEEISITVLSDNSLFATYRTVAGHPAHAYSRDGGYSWTKSEFMKKKPSGEILNNPRAANFVRKIEEGKHKGKYIYWFHNNKRKDFLRRNPVYLLGGIEKNSPEGKVIHWGNPVAILYSLNPKVRISYPDFIWDDNNLYITETQKSIARIHLIPDSLIEKLWE